MAQHRGMGSLLVSGLGMGLLRGLLAGGLGFVLVLQAGCIPAPDPLETKDETKSDAGFIELPAIPFSLKNPGSSPSSFTSSRARVFYSYHPAKVAPDAKPLFVMLNGGPGCATTLNLFANNTAPYTLNREYTEGNVYAENRYSWTEIGNLLYIDAPNAGFSYELTRAAWWFPNRIGEFGVQNYNPFIDAAQVVRVILQFLDEHPALKANEVILVGESYGGTRVSTMLNLLLFHKSYGDGSRIYRDDGLVAIIDSHFRTQLPQERKNEPITPQMVAAQFGRQILIQPQLTGPYEMEITGDMYEADNSIIDQILKRRYSRCGALDPCLFGRVVHAQQAIRGDNRDQYNYSKPKTWSDDLERDATEGLLDVTVLSKILGVDVKTIDAFKPAARKDEGYRYISGILNMESSQGEDGLASLSPDALGWLALDEESRAYIEASLEQDGVRSRANSLEKVLGSLKPCDDYLSGTNRAVYITFQYNWGTIIGYDISPDRSPVYGQMFLQNLALVRTFITDAALDLVIYSPAVPASIARYTSIVSQVDASRGDSTKDGSFTITFIPSSLGLDDVPTPVTRTIYWPHYANSGHSVSSTQPDKFLADVTRWLSVMPEE